MRTDVQMYLTCSTHTLPHTILTSHFRFFTVRKTIRAFTDSLLDLIVTDR